jgi:hypothetical protein
MFPILFFIAGILLIVIAIADWDPFMESKWVDSLVDNWGRNGARAAMISSGIFLMLNAYIASLG